MFNFFKCVISDFFFNFIVSSSQGSLHLFFAENHQIDLQILLMDDSGRWWRSNVEKESIFVRCGDEQARIEQQINNQNNRVRNNRKEESMCQCLIKRKFVVLLVEKTTFYQTGLDKAYVKYFNHIKNIISNRFIN